MPNVFSAIQNWRCACPICCCLLCICIYSFRLLKGNSALHTLSFFILLCTNDLLVGLFGMARGYGLSFGFMLMSFFHFTKYLTQGGTGQLALFHLAALLASLSNFTLLTVYLALLFIFNLVLFTEHKLLRSQQFNVWQHNKWNLAFFLLSAIVLYEPVRRLIAHASLDFGGKNGFYADTLSELAYYTLNNSGLVLYKVPALFILLLKMLFTLFPALGLGIIFYQTKNKSTAFFAKHKALIVSTLLLWTIAAIIILQHMLLGADYPIGRFTIFLFPLFLLQAACLARYACSMPYRNYILASACVLALLSAGKFVYNFNQQINAEWVYDADTKNMMAALQTDYRQNGQSQKPIAISAGWLFEPTINYYRVQNSLTWLKPAQRKAIDTASHYFYLQQHELPLVQNTSCSLIKAFPVSGTVLLRNNLPTTVRQKTQPINIYR